MNPFQYQKLATGKNFCGRSVEISSIMRLIHDSQSILLYSERRYGKTSLIKEIFRQLENETESKVLCIYLDIYDLITAHDFAMALYTSISNALPFSLQESLKKIRNYFTKISFELGLSKDGQPKITPRLGGREFEELVDDALSGLAIFCTEQNYRAVIAIDEFQQITEVKDKRIDALLRKYLQESKNYSFIFSGSKRHLLASLFTLRDAPLYNMASALQLQGLQPDELYQFCLARMDIPVDRNYFDQIYALSRGQTKLIIQFFYHAFYTLGVINTEVFEQLIQRLIDETDGQYRMYFERIPTQQKRALRIIAEYDGQGIYQKTVLAKHELTKNQLQSAINKLINSEEIDKHKNNNYYVVDVGFALWCKYRLHY